MKSFILENIKRDHEPRNKGHVNIDYLSHRIRDKAYKISNLNGMSVERVSIFEYRRHDDVDVSVHSSVFENYELSYRLDIYDDIEEMIVGAIALLYIDEITAIPCVYELYAITNAKDEPQLVYYVDDDNYKGLFKMVKLIAKESIISINNCYMRQINYDDCSHKYFYIPPIESRILGYNPTVEKIFLK